MTTLEEFRCETCGRITNSPTHWFVIQWSDASFVPKKGLTAPTLSCRQFFKRYDSQLLFPGCATFKLSRSAARLPVILEPTTQLTTAKGDNGIGSAYGPEHTGLFEPAQNRFAARLDDSRTHE